MHMKCKPNERSLMLSSDKLYKYLVKLWPVKLDKENCQEVADTSRIREFLRINPPSFISSMSLRIQKTLLERFKRFLRLCTLLMLGG